LEIESKNIAKITWFNICFANIVNKNGFQHTQNALDKKVATVDF